MPKQLFGKNIPFGSKVSILWVGLLILGFAPVFVPQLKPLWRILCWVAPTFLALDADAGNHRWVYVAKFILWLMFNAMAIPALYLTNGFRREAPVDKEGPVIVACLLFCMSCALTVFGYSKRKQIWMGRLIKLKPTELRPIDSTTYANRCKLFINTSLIPADFEDAQLNSSAVEQERRLKEVREAILRTSLMTEFVMRRTFKSTQDKVYVYSLVACFRARLLLLALVLAGLYNIFGPVFEQQGEHDIVQSMILWLTLPTITLPSVLKLRFGNNATPWNMVQGFLPVDLDKDMWKRLGISPRDLFKALTNAVGSEMVVVPESAKAVPLLDRGGTGSVRVFVPSKARRSCGMSLIRLRDTFVRVSDGARFRNVKPNGLQPLGAFQAKQGDGKRKKEERKSDKMHIKRENSTDVEKALEGEGSSSELSTGRVGQSGPRREWAWVPEDFKVWVGESESVPKQNTEGQEWRFLKREKGVEGDDGGGKAPQDWWGWAKRLRVHGREVQDEKVLELLRELASEYGRGQLEWKEYKEMDRAVEHQISEEDAVLMLDMVRNGMGGLWKG